MTEQGANSGKTDRFSPDGPIQGVQGVGAIGFTTAAEECEAYLAEALLRNDGQYGEADRGEPVGAVLCGFLGFLVGWISRAQRMAYVFMGVPSE